MIRPFITRKQSAAAAWLLAALMLLSACGSRTPAGGAAVPETAAGPEAISAPAQAEALPAPSPAPSEAPAPTEEAAAETETEPKTAAETEAPWEWTYATPESQDMDAAALSALHATYDAFPLLAAVIVRNGVVVDTYFKDGYDEASVFTLQSVSKSITSALVGIALAGGELEDIDAPLADYFPALRSAADPRWADITLRHLLTHTSGIASTDSSIWYDWRASENWLDYLFALPIYTDPGTRFDYSTGNTHLLGAVLEQATGMPLGDYAQQVLFAPLGMTSAGLGTAPEGVGDGGNGFYMTTLDLARFGLLYLDGGLWQGRQLVPADWVEASTTTQATRASDGARYGYQWWLRSFDGHEAFVAQGHFGQYIIAVPDLALLIAINSDFEGARSIYWQIAGAVIAACSKA